MEGTPPTTPRGAGIGRDDACPSVLRVAPATPKKKSYPARDYKRRRQAGVSPPKGGVMSPTRSDSPDLAGNRQERRVRHNQRGHHSNSNNNHNQQHQQPQQHRHSAAHGSDRDGHHFRVSPVVMTSLTNASRLLDSRSRSHPTPASHSGASPREGGGGGGPSARNSVSLSRRFSEGTPEGSPLNLIAFRSLDTFPSPSASLGTGQFLSGWFHSQFRVIGELGRGNFGHVVLAQNNLDQMPYAVKVLESVIRSQRELARRIDEGKALARCSSTHIVRYFSCWVESESLYLQCEYCPGGTLSERMAHFQSQKIKWLESAIVSLLLQMTLALYHLHNEVKVAHLDVKPGNIFIGGDGNYKLGDFGHAHFLEEQGNTGAASSIFNMTAGGSAAAPPGAAAPATDAGAKTRFSRGPPRRGGGGGGGGGGGVGGVGNSADSCASAMRFSLEEGDVRYLPMEMLNDKSYLCEADIFSLGVSLYEVASGVQVPKGDAPWMTLREEGIKKEAILANIKLDCSSPPDPAATAGAAASDEGSMLIPIISGMMHKDPTKRPGASELLTTHRELFTSKYSYAIRPPLSPNPPPPPPRSKLSPPLSAEYLMAVDKARAHRRASIPASTLATPSFAHLRASTSSLPRSSTPPDLSASFGSSFFPKAQAP